MGDKEYYSNYFLDVIDMTESQKNTVQSQIKSYNPTTDQGRSTTLVWSYLDTSVHEMGVFGIEVLSFTDYQLVIDFTSFKGYKPEKATTVFNCALGVASSSTQESFSVPFSIKVENTPYIIGFNETYFSSSSGGSSGNDLAVSDAVESNLGEGGVPVAKRDYKILVKTFDQYTSIEDFELAFTGEVMSTAIFMEEEDIKNATISV